MCTGFQDRYVDLFSWAMTMCMIMNKNCRIGHLRGDLFHYSYPTIKHHVTQIDRFSDIAAREAFKRGRQANVFTDICLNPMLTFLKKYFLKLGVLDGYEGFIISINTAYGKYLKYIKLREWNRQCRQEEPN